MPRTMTVGGVPSGASSAGGVANRRIDHREHRIGQVLWLLEFEGEFGIGQHRRDLLHPVERLDPALRLLGLAGLGLEARNEGLQVGDLFGLLGHRRLLQQHLFGAHVFELAVVAAVADQLGVVDVQRDAGNRVEEFAVVADHHQRALITLEPGFEPDERVQVEVVGRFVEQQDVGRTHQRTSQLQAHAPTAGEAVDRLFKLGDREAKAEDQRLGAGRGIMCAGIVQRHVGFGHAHAVVARLGRGHFGIGGEQRAVAFDHEVGRRLIGFRHVLRHLRHAPGGRHRKIAAIFVQGAVDQAEQR